MSPRLLPLIKESGVLHWGDNRSRHSPIYLRLRLGNLPINKEKNEEIPSRPTWSRAELSQLDAYTVELERRLTQIMVPHCCDDIHCDTINHSESNNDHLLNIIIAMIETSHKMIPMLGGATASRGRASRGGLPGWKEEVEPHRQESRLRHDVWLQQG